MKEFSASEIMLLFGISKKELFVWRKLGKIEFRKENGRKFVYKHPNSLNNIQKFPIYRSSPQVEMKIDNTGVWYTAENIMQIFSISRQMLYNWRKSGKIEYQKMTKRTFMYKFPKEFEN